MKRPRLLTRIVLGVALLAGCGSSSPTPDPTGTPSASVRLPPSVEPSRTLPPSERAIEPGTYTWVEFTPPISFEVGPGWEMGHRNPEFFDLFLAGDFPAISFARPAEVFTDATTRVDASDATTMIDALAARPDLVLTTPRPSEVAGLSGQAFTIRSTETQVPIFAGPNGTFRMDPGFETRYLALDVPDDGLILVGVVARKGELEAAQDAAAPVLASLAVAR